MRSYRCRLRNEEILLKISVCREDVVAALVGIDALPAGSAADDDEIERALNAQIAEWAREWGERA